MLACRQAARRRRAAARRIDCTRAFESARAIAGARRLDRGLRAPAGPDRSCCHSGTDDNARIARRATGATGPARRGLRPRRFGGAGRARAGESVDRNDADSARGHDDTDQSAGRAAARHASAGDTAGAEQPAGHGANSSLGTAVAGSPDHARSGRSVDSAIAGHACRALPDRADPPAIRVVTAARRRSANHASPDADATVVGRAALGLEVADPGLVDPDPASAQSADDHTANRIHRCDPPSLARSEWRCALDAGYLAALHREDGTGNHRGAAAGACRLL